MGLGTGRDFLQPEEEMERLTGEKERGGEMEIDVQMEARQCQSRLSMEIETMRGEKGTHFQGWQNQTE